MQPSSLNTCFITNKYCLILHFFLFHHFHFLELTESWIWPDDCFPWHTPQYYLHFHFYPLLNGCDRKIRLFLVSHYQLQMIYAPPWHSYFSSFQVHTIQKDCPFRSWWPFYIDLKDIFLLPLGFHAYLTVFLFFIFYFHANGISHTYGYSLKHDNFLLS